MKITDITVRHFRTRADSWDRDHGVPIRDEETVQTLLTIETDEGVSGHYFGGSIRGDHLGLNAVEVQFIRGRVRNLIVGMDPLVRELIWKYMWVAANMPEPVGSDSMNPLSCGWKVAQLS